MASSKHRSTTKSTSSARLTTKATSRRSENSSRTAAPSFVLDGNPPDPEKRRMEDLLLSARTRLERLEATPVPRLAFHRKMHLQRLAQLRRHIAMVQEALQS